jgi:hypothetical protein
VEIQILHEGLNPKNDEVDVSRLSYVLHTGHRVATEVGVG